MEKNYKKDPGRDGKEKDPGTSRIIDEGQYMSKEVIQRLATASEFKDTETGAHISRMGLYAQKIAHAMGMPVDFVETITFASPMHDVGKIGIPDCILLKADRLTPQEFEIMKTHTTKERRYYRARHITIYRSQHRLR